MNVNRSETKEHLRLTLALVRKTLYKTIEFQILFKIFYIGILFFVVSFLFGVFIDILNYIVTALKIGETIRGIKILSIIDISVIFVLSITLFIIIYVYLVEKNGVIIIESEYYRNRFISFFRVFLLSVKKTPLFIWRRIKEMRVLIMVFAGLYVMWKILEIFSLPEWIMTIFATILFIYGAILFFSILFRYTFTAFITFLRPNENPEDFNRNVPDKFFRKRARVSVVFYTVLIVVVFIWLVLFAIVAQILFNLATIYPSFFSAIFAFFVSFTIVSVLVFFSFFKTFKVGIMTILYYEERRRQGFDIKTLKPKNQPALSKNIHLAILAILSVVIVGGALLTASIKTKTDQIIDNADEYFEQVRESGGLIDIDLDDLSIQDLVREAISQEDSAVDIIEKVILSYLAYVVDE